MLQGSLQLITDLNSSSLYLVCYSYDFTLSPLNLTSVSVAYKTISSLFLVSNSEYCIKCRKENNGQ